MKCPELICSLCTQLHSYKTWVAHSRKIWCPLDFSTALQQQKSFKNITHICSLYLNQKELVLCYVDFKLYVQQLCSLKMT